MRSLFYPALRIEIPDLFKQKRCLTIPVEFGDNKWRGGQQEALKCDLDPDLDRYICPLHPGTFQERFPDRIDVTTHLGLREHTESLRNQTLWHLSGYGMRKE